MHEQVYANDFVELGNSEASNCHEDLEEGVAETDSPASQSCSTNHLNLQLIEASTVD